MRAFILGLSASFLFLLVVGAAEGGRTGAGPSAASEYNWGDKATGILYKVEREGDVRFTADDADIQALAANGLLRIRETQRDRTTVFEVRRPGEASSLSLSFSVNGQAKSAVEAKVWLAGVLPTVIRRTGLDAANRVSRLREKGGVDAVLAEARSLPSDWVKGLYSQELVTGGNLSPADLRRVLAASTDAISSGYERAELLHHTVRTFLASPELAAPYFAQVNRVPSPFRGDLLTQIGQEAKLDNPVVRAEYQAALRQAGMPAGSSR